tara:strand:- start:70007 stop:71056 length:1050 start_codon:yes stop_codon:yes gene_type:complete
MKKICLAILLFCSVSAFAVPVAGLYQAKIPVASQASQIREQAIAQALQEVIAKVGGNSTVLQDDDLQAALKQPDSYTQEYSYLRNPDKTQTATPYLLQVRFQPGAIDQLLHKTGQTVWPKDRPIVLAWIAVDDFNGRQLLSADSPSPFVKDIQTMADKRGLPLILPALDLTDMGNVTVTDVWAPFVDVVEKASLRYGANAIVMVQLTKNVTGTWDGQWTLAVGDNQSTWQINDADQDGVITQGMNDVTDALAQRYASLGQGSQEALTITVDNITDLNRLAKAEKYLQNLAPVQQTTVMQVKGKQVQFQLSLQGTQEDVQQAIQLDHVLQPLNLNQTDNAIPSQLMFRLG